MRRCDLEYFQLAGSSIPLSFVGETEGDSLVNGVIHTAHITKVEEAIPAGAVFNEVAFLKEPGDTPGNGWPDEGIRTLVKGGWIARNWKQEILHADSHPTRDQFCSSLSSVDGPILEIAAGPGGGNLAPVLHRNPEAHIIINDWSYRVLRLWKDFLTRQGSFPNICYAVFDARSMPLRDGSMGAISSSGGFSEIASRGEGHKVLTEAYRVLCNGGRMYCMESTIESDDWHRVPSDIKIRWEIEGLLGGFGKAATRAGFELVSENH